MMVNNTLLKCLTVLGIIILFLPTVNFWRKILLCKGFKSGKELTSFIIFQCLFNLSLYYICFVNLKITAADPSFIVVFLLVQLLFFTVLSAITPLPYGIALFIDAISKKSDFKITVKNVHVCNVINTYFKTDKADDAKFLLSGEYVGLFIVGCYFLSGLLTASNIANGIIISLSEAYKNSIVTVTKKLNLSIIQDIYHTDLQLYTNIFIIAAIPLFINFFAHKNKLLK